MEGEGGGGALHTSRLSNCMTQQIYTHLKHSPQVSAVPAVDGVAPLVDRQQVADAVPDATPGDGVFHFGQGRQVRPLVLQQFRGGFFLLDFRVGPGLLRPAGGLTGGESPRSGAG